MSGLLAGCTKKEIPFRDMTIDFTTIEVSEGTTGNQVTLDEEKSIELYDKIKSIEFNKGKSSKATSGWSYAITFIKEDMEVIKLFIIDDNTIDFKNYFYEAESSCIEMDYLNRLFEKKFEAMVIEINPSLIVMPNADSNEFKSSDKIAVSATDAVLNDWKGEEISLNDLRVGDTVEIIYNGVIMESYPAQISCYRIELKEESLLISGYMALIDDIYLKEVPGLGANISILAIDTTDMTNITETEKQRLLIKLQDRYRFRAEVVEGTFDELVEEGMIDKANLSFKDGILITIKHPIFDEKEKSLNCGFEKWCSGIGAIGSDEIIAQYDGTTWKITINFLWKA